MWITEGSYGPKKYKPSLETSALNIPVCLWNILIFLKNLYKICNRNWSYFFDPSLPIVHWRQAHLIKLELIISLSRLNVPTLWPSGTFNAAKRKKGWRRDISNQFGAIEPCCGMCFFAMSRRNLLSLEVCTLSHLLAEDKLHQLVEKKPIPTKAHCFAQCETCVCPSTSTVDQMSHFWNLVRLRMRDWGSKSCEIAWSRKIEF